MDTETGVFVSMHRHKTLANFCRIIWRDTLELVVTAAHPIAKHFHAFTMAALVDANSRVPLRIGRLLRRAMVAAAAMAVVEVAVAVVEVAVALVEVAAVPVIAAVAAAVAAVVAAVVPVVAVHIHGTCKFNFSNI
jgi:hypothetical protein